MTIMNDNLPHVKALIFDAFGTTVNWRKAVSQELESRALKSNDQRLKTVDWNAFMNDWRNIYKTRTKSNSKRVVPDTQAFIDVDTIHREGLDDLIKKYNIENAYSSQELDSINNIWHSLPPWPDVCHGIDYLKSNYIVCTLSGANTRLLVDMSKFANLNWDLLVSADLTRTYKPNPVAYLKTCDMLNLKPDECAMVAAHSNDCRAAKSVGLRTIYINRSNEEDEPDSINHEEFDIYIDGTFDINDTQPKIIDKGFISLANALIK